MIHLARFEERHLIVFLTISLVQFKVNYTIMDSLGIQLLAVLSLGTGLFASPVPADSFTEGGERQAGREYLSTLKTSQILVT